MKFPDLPTWETSKLFTQAFLGLNRGLSIADGEMADMRNLTADQYPVLSTRAHRGLHRWRKDGVLQEATLGAAPSGMLGTDRLIVCSGEDVLVDGEVMPVKVSADESMQPKHMVSMGAYVCIWPDKVYFNLANPDDYGSMGSAWEAEEGASISAMMCRKDGTDYDLTEIMISKDPPNEPANLDFWLDTSGENDILKQYSTIYKQWVEVATTYIKIQATGIGRGLKEGDVVWLTGARIATVGETAEPAVLSVTREAANLSFPAEGFSLYSSFNTTQSGTSFTSTTPTIAERTKTITVSGIPEGAKVEGAVLRFTAGSPMYGKKLLTVNGVSFGYGGQVELPVTITGNGDVSFQFRFQSGNNANSPGAHGGSVVIDDLSLTVSYSVSAPEVEPDTPEESVEKDVAQVEALNTSMTIYGCGDDYIIVAGILHTALTLADTLAWEMKIPDLDYVCEANNRLWGCSYSKLDGVLTNEIRCCALGDFRNWWQFAGISTDSYVMSVGSDGKFTGAFSLQGVPLFFKEGCLHKISGTQPSNFTLNTVKCRGVQEGSWRSLAVVNEVLYYKARLDVMAYDGSLPYAVSEKLGQERYYEAVGGGYRDKYYISMRDGGNVWHMLVLDTRKGLWHAEDNTHALHMASANGELILADGLSLHNLANPQRDKEEMDWSVTFGVYGYTTPEQKYLSRFDIRAQMAAGAELALEIQYDSDGKWRKMGGPIRSRMLRTDTIPVIPRRCDHCQVRLSGKGDVRIYSIARIYDGGGDGNVSRGT